MTYEIIYDWDNWDPEYPDAYSEEKNIREEFTGTWTELQEYIKTMKKQGCYNIDATCISGE